MSWLLLHALIPAAWAGPAAPVLQAVDELLQAVPGAGRVDTEAPVLCVKGGIPKPENRDFLCHNTTQVGAWKITGLPASGGERVWAQLELRAFNNAAAGEALKAEALRRFDKARPVGVPDGCFSWCYTELVWTAELLLVLDYGCHISVDHVPALASLRRALFGLGAAHASGATGVLGSHSGWCTLLKPTPGEASP